MGGAQGGEGLALTAAPPAENNYTQNGFALVSVNTRGLGWAGLPAAGTGWPGARWKPAPSGAARQAAYASGRRPTRRHRLLAAWPTAAQLGSWPAVLAE